MEPVLLAVTSSEEAAVPVFARLWCFCSSLSEGERDLLRFESASGIANLVYRKVQLRRIGGARPGKTRLGEYRRRV